ncbi:MAG: capsule assembly Wzi family protein, partial [Melioribacter sp.]|nr:capsule assembly Wzi family protein [Melioribacter sp.]
MKINNAKRFFAVLLTTFFLLLTSYSFSQQENVPLDHQVYIFLKEMKVKNLPVNIHDDSPNMSRAEIKRNLECIDSLSADLSVTEKKILKKFQNEFYDDLADSTNTYQFFGEQAGFSKSNSDIFSHKIKYVYAYRSEGANYFLNVLGRAVYGQNLKPYINNSWLYDIGFRFRGTLFEKLGYSLTVQKGGVSGSQDFAPILEPRLKYNFKFVENIENISNYDFTEGYLRYYTEPVKDMSLAFQIGREKIKFGYGYESKLVLSGDHPLLDFFRINFNYGIFSFTSLHASTVGEFNADRSQNFTKLIALNRFKLHFKDFLDFGLGEDIIYSGRGIDLAYLNPLAFYKFEEMSLQDRDNGALWLDLQTNCFKNLEFQLTYFLDDNPLGNLQDFSSYINKTGYQIGAFWYSPFSIDDLSLIFEYTRIRPYVYSHINPKNSYTAFNQLLGHHIGPNSDEIFLQIAYNFDEKIRFNFEYQYIRHGQNIYDSQGNLVFNAGGDAFVAHRDNIDPMRIDFLDGERINQNIFTFNVRFEPYRNFVFD